MKVHEFMHEMRTTSAVLGRKHGIQVQFEGDRAATDGETIYLPALPLDKDLTPEQVRAMRGYVDHEAGHIRHSDMPRVLDFYDRCMHNGKEDLKNLHNALEDIWMENRVIEEYAGSEKNIRQVAELVKGKEIEHINEVTKETGENPMADINNRSAGFAISSVGRQPYGEENVEAAVNLLPDELREHAERWAEEARKCNNSEEVITLAKSVYQHLQQDPDLSSNPEDFDPESGEGMDEGENSPDFDKDSGDNPFSEGEGSSKGKDKGGEDGDALSEKLKGDIAEALNCAPGDGASGAIGSNDGDLKGAYRVATTANDVEYHRGMTYAEGTHREVVDIVNSTDYSEYEERKALIKGNIMTMKNKLKRSLLAKQQRDWDPGREVGRLDSRRLVSAYTGSRTVFKQRIDREEEDTAVTLLVDLSGSMWGGKDEVARDCLIALSECLDGTGISFNVVGFCNKRNPWEGEWGKYHRVEALDTVFFKDFDTPLRVCRASIGLLPEAVGGNNTDYDFIVNATNDLKKRAEKRKVLMVLSDGSPACYSRASTSELIRHCKQATKDAKKDGVECIGIGITDSSVERIYEDNVVVNNVSDLSSTVFSKLTDLLVNGEKAH